MISVINNLRNSAIQSEEIIFILRQRQRGLLSEHNDKRVTLVYLYHVNRWDTPKLLIAKLDFVQVCGLSLNFYNNIMVSFTNSATVGRLEQV